MTERFICLLYADGSTFWVIPPDGRVLAPAYGSVNKLTVSLFVKTDYFAVRQDGVEARVYVLEKADVL